MEIGDIVNIVQLCLWSITVGIAIYRRATGKSKFHPKIEALLRSNLLIWTLILIGFGSSVMEMSKRVARSMHWNRDVVSIGAYTPGDSNTAVVSKRVFDRDNVPLDGYVYDNCTFIDSCFMYNGGTYQLNNAKIIGRIQICAREKSAVNNFRELEKSLGMLNPALRESEHSIILPKQ